MIKKIQPLNMFKYFKLRQSQIHDTNGVVFAKYHKHRCKKKVVVVTMIKYTAISL